MGSKNTVPRSVGDLTKSEKPKGSGISRRKFLYLGAAASAGAVAAYLGYRFLTPAQPPTLPSRVKGAVVIGAGLSGLAAAVDLMDAGVDVRVLEKHPWIGGRVKTRHWPNGQITEIGAEDILNLDSYIWKRINAYGIPSEEKLPALDAYYVGGTYIPPPEGLAENAAFIAEIESLPISQEARQSYWEFTKILIDFEPPYGSEIDPRYDAQNYKDFVLESGYHPDVEWFTGVNMKAELCALNSEVNAMLGLDTYYYYYLARWYRTKGGNQQIPLAMAERLGDRVVTGVEVSEVRQTPNEVIVSYTRDGERKEIRSDVCVVSVRAPEVIDVIPDLSTEKVQALREVKYGSYVLPQMRFSRRFWKLDYGLNTWSVNTDLTTNYFVDQTYTQGGEDGILVGWIAADDAKRLFSSLHHGNVTGDEKEAVIDAALSDLEQIYPRAREFLAESYVTQWKYALPYFHPGYLSLLPALRESFDRIFFCGDYTEGPGMDTALLSGERAAREILASGRLSAVAQIPRPPQPA